MIRLKSGQKVRGFTSDGEYLGVINHVHRGGKSACIMRDDGIEGGGCKHGLFRMWSVDWDEDGGHWGADGDEGLIKIEGKMAAADRRKENRL